MLREWVQFIKDVIEPPHTKEVGPVAPKKSVWKKYESTDGDIILVLNWEKPELNSGSEKV